MNRRTALGCVAWATLACGGASLDENRAGGDGWLDHVDPPATEPADLAHDGRCAWTGNPYVSTGTERAYALLYETDDGDCDELPADAAYEKTVWGLAVDDAAPALLIDVSGHEDVRLLDSADGLLLMGEVDGLENLYRIDESTLALLGEATVDARYWGTRTSPSRRWVAVGDNADAALRPIDLIDPRTLQTATLDGGADWVEAMWLRGSDTLAAVLFDDLAGPETSLSLRLWSLDGLLALPRDERGEPMLPEPTLSLDLEGYGPAMGFAYTWIGVDPLDRYVVFPVADLATGVGVLLVLDVVEGTTREVRDAWGPVAFTPDGGSIVAWAQQGDADELVLVDPVTLAVERVPVPVDGVPEYHVSADGDDVLVADVFGESELLLVDLDTGEQATLGASLALSAYTSRVGHQEVWAVDQGLWRIDLDDVAAEEIALGWDPGHVVWMPTSDLLFLDDLARPRMILWDPDTREVVTDAELGTDLRAAPRLSLARR